MPPQSSKIGTKRYHVTDFRRPYMPDQEREELPYSVILDFNGGSTLQCACENGSDQRGVLHGECPNSSPSGCCRMRGRRCGSSN